MPRKRNVVIDDIVEEKLDYLGLDLYDLPKTLIECHDIDFKPIKGYDEKQYKQYRYVNIKDIDILLTPKNRLDDIGERYNESAPLFMYLNSDEDEDLSKYATFIKMIKKVDVAEIEKIQKEQELLSKNIPFRVKFSGNYLWQIYYSDYSERYFMMVPTEDSDYSTFFYLLKKKIENKKEEKIYVPISYCDYSGDILKRAELRDLENYLWLFTKDYPSIYEVYDKKENPSLHIVGEAQIYGKIKTLYKMVFDSTKSAAKFYKLLKALFILQTELPRYYDFNTKIESNGNLIMHLYDELVEYENLPKFVYDQYKKSIGLKEKNNEDIEQYTEKLDILKKEVTELEKEYLSKEKQISTYLECKKSFFGKVKYYFKLGKDTEKHNKKKKKNKEEIILEEKSVKKSEKIVLEDRNYTLDELVVSYKELEILENNKKNIVMDINALKLKSKNLKKKIENATLYINEINNHKRSIFEFWKYSNKDEVAALEEGEEEELNNVKIEKIFEYDEDFEKFGEIVDKNQRKRFTDSELESSYIASTDVLPLINRTYKKQADAQEFSNMVKSLKDQKDDPGEEFDIFGNYSSIKERTLGKKTHRETHRNKYRILDIRKGMKGLELKKIIVEIVKDLKKALLKNVLDEEMYVYKASTSKLDMNELQAFSLNEENELNEALKMAKTKRRVYLYKIRLHKGTNFIGFTNIIYYNNKNMTLPVGMQLSDKILVDLTKANLKECGNKELIKAYMESSKNDFSKVTAKIIDINEFEVFDYEEKADEIVEETENNEE